MRRAAPSLIVIIFFSIALPCLAQDTSIPEAGPESRDELLRRITQHASIKAISVAPDGILAAASERLRIWDGINGHSLASLVGLYPNPFEALAFSPDGTTVAGMSTEGELNAWTVSPLAFKTSFIDRPGALRSGQNRAHFGSRANAIAFSPDGKFLASVAADAPPMKIWDVETGQLVKEIAPTGTSEMTAVAFSPDGSLLAYASQHDVVFLKVPDWTISLTISAHQQRINSIAFSPDGSVLATASDDQTAHVWRVEKGESVTELKGHTDVVRAVVFSPDSELIATASLDKTVRVWTKDGRQIGRIAHPRPVYAVGFTDAGTELITGAADNTVRLWRVSDWKLTQRLIPPPQGVPSTFLLEKNSSASDKPSSENARPYPASPLKVVPIKRLDDTARHDLGVIAASIISSIQTDQFQDLVTLFNTDRLTIDGGEGSGGPPLLNDREGLLIRLYDTVRLRSIVGPFIAEHEPTMENIYVQRFRSLRDILRNDEPGVATQILERSRTSTEEDAATIVIFWGSDPSNYGLREYPRFGLSRSKGHWSISDVTLPLDDLTPSRFSAVQSRTRQVRSFTDNFVRNGMAEGALKTILVEHPDALAFEIDFPKDTDKWIPGTLGIAEVVFRWDGDSSDYALGDYPRIRIRLENGAWRLIPPAE